MRHIVKLGELTINNGATTSNLLTVTRTLETMIDIMIFTPIALDGTVTLYAGFDETTTPVRKVYIGGVAVTLPALGAVAVPAAGFRSLYLISGASETAQRVFTVMSQVDMAY